jgi:hypothetical protein
VSSNIRIFAVEQTQSIQFFNSPVGQGSGYAPDNSVPLIKGKPTVLRLYIDARQNDGTIPIPMTVDGVVWAVNHTTGASAIYKSANGPIGTREAAAIVRVEPNRTLDFVIPWNVCQDQVVCWIGIFDPDDPFSQNKDGRPLTLDFIEIPPFRLHSVLIRYTGVDASNNPVDVSATWVDVLSVADYLLRVYPVSDFAYGGCEILEWKDRLDIADNVYALKAVIGCMGYYAGCDELYAGFIPIGAPQGKTTGVGGGGAAVFWVNRSAPGYGPASQRDAAHEIGHALDRVHAPECLNAGDAGDQSYPQYDGFPRASIGECGIDTRNLELFTPTIWRDYMSYCTPAWTSPYGYDRIMTALKNGNYSPSACTKLQAQFVLHHYFVFRVDERGTGVEKPRVTVFSSFRVARPPPVPRAEQSDVRVELLDGRGELLHSSLCETDPHVDPDVGFRYYRSFFPHFEDLRRIRIVKDDAILSEHLVGAHAPKLTRVALTHEQDCIRLRWIGRADERVSPPLEFAVRFSCDGRTWRSLAAATTRNELVFDTRLLPGGDACRVQVAASAGFQTTVYETPTFSLPIKPRVAFIASPSPESQYELQEPVSFTGTAYSPDFGNSKPEEIVWTSLSAGILGVGQSLMTTELPVGHHWVTMHAPDGMGGLATRNVALRVVPRKGRGTRSLPGSIATEMLLRGSYLPK